MSTGSTVDQLPDRLRLRGRTSARCRARRDPAHDWPTGRPSARRAYFVRDIARYRLQLRTVDLSKTDTLPPSWICRIKDHINIKGRVSSSGVLAWALEGKKDDADGIFTRILREAGAGASPSIINTSVSRLTDGSWQ